MKRKCCDRSVFNSGFTLVELSIVLVIIGLLTGGILAAQSMIQTTKIQKLITDLQQFDVAITNFRLNYKQYPGDTTMFLPPGDGISDLSGAVGCHSSPYDVYSTLERAHVFSHLVASGMLKASYVSYSPVACGGPHADDDGEVANDGLLYPYTELRGAAVSELNRTKYPITPAKTATGNFNLAMTLHPLDVATLEGKLGSQADSQSAIGLTNHYGVGMCMGGVTVSCGSPTAILGRLLYYINPQ